jgi:hypothetical protein
VSPLPFLTDLQREQLGSSASERDLTGSYLRAYAVSGEAVRFSSSEVGFDGPTLPPGCFVESDTQIETHPGDGDDDPFAAEERVPTAPSSTDGEPSGTPGENSAPSVVLPIQLRGLSAYSRTGTRLGDDYTRRPMDPQSVAIVLERQKSRRSPELVSISVQHLEQFRSCPFAYLLDRALGLRETELDVDPDSSRELGSHYHNVLQFLFEGLERSGRVFRADGIEEYLVTAMEYSDTLAAGAAGMIPPGVYRAFRPRFERVFRAVLERDAELIDRHAPIGVEEWEQHEDPDRGTIRVGRLDRVTRAPDGSLTLVDYKKRTIPGAKELIGDLADATDDGTAADALASVSSIQIPFYISLLASGGQSVGAAYYYSLEKPDALAVLDDRSEKPAMTSVEMTRLVAQVDRLVDYVVDRLHAGDYRCVSQCDGCAFRSVCRTRFVVR